MDSYQAYRPVLEAVSFEFQLPASPNPSIKLQDPSDQFRTIQVHGYYSYVAGS